MSVRIAENIVAIAQGEVLKEYKAKEVFDGNSDLDEVLTL